VLAERRKGQTVRRELGRIGKKELAVKSTAGNTKRQRIRRGAGAGYRPGKKRWELWGEKKNQVKFVTCQIGGTRRARTGDLGLVRIDTGKR